MVTGSSTPIRMSVPTHAISAGYLERGREGPAARSGRNINHATAPAAMTYTKGQRRYRRRLGMAEPDTAPAGYMAGFTGVKRVAPAVTARRCRSRRAHQGHGPRRRRCEPDTALGLVRHLDRRRRCRSRNGDVPRLSPLDGGLLRRLSRTGSAASSWPARATSRVRSAEIRQWGRASWAWGMMVYAPVGMPLDHPALEPIYAEAADTRSCGRAAHLHGDAALCAGRAGHLGQSVAAALGGASLVRHAQHGGTDRQRRDGPLSDLRVGTLEAGHGWLPFWMARLDEHAETIKAALPELAHRPSEYVTERPLFPEHRDPRGREADQHRDRSGRRRCADVRVRLSAWREPLPESVSLVLDWTMDAERKRKLLWDNAVRFYARAPVGPNP